jgi:CubicO group peptidase (beta-lactamase class C family)
MQIPFAAVAMLLLCTESAPAWEWEAWTEDEARELGWSPEGLAAAREFAGGISTEAVMIVTGGKIVDSWGPLDRKFNAHSIRKSLLSAMAGIRVAEGVLKLDATMEALGIDDNEPGLTSVEKKATVHDLLKARSGVYHPALYETAGMKAARPARHSHAPGEFWYYNNWDFNALGTIYEQVTGAGIYEDLKRLIADPIGMEDYSVEDGKYVTGEDSIHRAYPFRMSARDLARFGLLYLRGGRWEGRQVIPADWVRDSVTAFSDAEMRGGYGYLWWVETGGRHLPGVTLPPGSYSARGAGGHYILNIPALDTVIVHRVDTDQPGRQVASSEFGELARLILAARTAPADAPVETRLALLMSRHRVPGAALVRIEQGRLTGETYLGVREAGKPELVTADTLFEAASMTKPLCAVAAMRLVERGKLDLDRPLVEYLGGPYIQDEPLHLKITARMALNHTGGFPNWRPKGGALKVRHEPGSAFRYSGEGILMLQRAIEKITGRYYEEYMRAELLEPLGMSLSSHVWREDRADLAAAGHDKSGQPKADRRLYSRPNAAYSLYCSASDYARFVISQMDAKFAGDGFRPVTDASRAQMFTPSSPSAGRELRYRQGRMGEGDIRFGIGWAIEPASSGPRICHGGSNGTGFRSHAEFDPADGHGLILFTNGEGGSELRVEMLEELGVP